MQSGLTFRQGVKDCLPTVLGYIGIGFAMGVVGKGVGLSVIQVATMSILVYAGSAQFIICGLLALNAPISSIVLTVFMVNFRHFLMSLSVAQHFKQAKLFNRIGLGTLLTDESYGVLTVELLKNKSVTSQWLHGLNLTAYLSWIFATMAGALFGGFIHNPETFGLDFALVAMFLGLFLFQVERLFKQKTIQTSILLLSIFCSLIILMRFFSAEVAVLASTLIGCFVGVMLHES